MRANHHRPGLWPGFLLVSVGTGLLARELGLLPAHIKVLDFWPLVIVTVGISVLLRAGGLVSAVLALAFIGTGGVLLAGNLGFLASSVTRFWPVLVVLLGLWALIRREAEADDPDPLSPLEGGSTLADGSSSGNAPLQPNGDADRLHRRYVAAGAQLRIESQAWKGGELIVTAGGVELDLRQASLAPEGAVLAVRVLMGGVDIRVPDTWQVHCDVTPLLGGADDLTRSTQGVGSAPRLRIVGNVTLGGVTVQN
jgi:Cell wall-active antibiotics response 4TMS YvqF/Domain of unknown function (DUF5668)